jgi:hypothetical protein
MEFDPHFATIAVLIGVYPLIGSFHIRADDPEDDDDQFEEDFDDLDDDEEEIEDEEDKPNQPEDADVDLSLLSIDGAISTWLSN